MTPNESAKLRIWEEVIKSKNFRTEVRPNEITKAQLMQKYNLTRHNADILIEDLLQEGQIISRPALSNGKPCTAYSFVEAKKE